MSEEQITIIICTSIITAGIGLMFNIIFDWMKRCNQKNLTESQVLSILISDLESKRILFSLRLNEMNDVNIDDIENYEYIFFPVRSNYFTVFDGITSKLGYIQDRKLRESIILRYSEVR